MNSGAQAVCGRELRQMSPQLRWSCYSLPKAAIKVDIVLGHGPQP